MAFTGTAAVVKISDTCFRITGLSLGAGDAGSISMGAGLGDVKLSNPEWGAEGGVGLFESVEVSCYPVSDVSNYAIPIRVVKTGSKASDFIATLTNDAAATASAELEIYVKKHN